MSPLWPQTLANKQGRQAIILHYIPDCSALHFLSGQTCRSISQTSCSFFFLPPRSSRAQMEPVTGPGFPRLLQHLWPRSRQNRPAAPSIMSTEGEELHQPQQQMSSKSEEEEGEGGGRSSGSLTPSQVRLRLRPAAEKASPLQTNSL